MSRNLAAFTGDTAGAAIANFLRTYGYITGRADSEDVFRAMGTAIDLALAYKLARIHIIFRNIDQRGCVLVASGDPIGSIFAIPQCPANLWAHFGGVPLPNDRQLVIIAEAGRILLNDEQVWPQPQH